MRLWSSEKAKKTVNNGCFKPGNKYGHGRPRKPEIEELRKAIDAVQKTKRKKLLIHFVERAYESDAVLTALGKKILPDLAAVDGNLNASESLQDFVAWMSERVGRR